MNAWVGRELNYRPTIEPNTLRRLHQSPEGLNRHLRNAWDELLADEWQTNHRCEQIGHPQSDLALWEIISASCLITPVIGLEDKAQVTPDAITEQLMTTPSQETARFL